MPLWRASLSQPRDNVTLAVAVSGVALAVAGIATVLSRRKLLEDANSYSRQTSAECEGGGVTEVSADADVGVAELAVAEASPELPEMNAVLAQPAATAAAEEPAAANAAAPEQDAALQPDAAAAAPVRERLMGLRTLLSSLQACERVCPDSIMGPFQMNAGTDEVPVVCFQFRMSHFTCKAFLAHGTQDEGSQHLKLQTTFEDNRRSLGEEQRYFIANEWNATKRYTRLKCGSGGSGRSSVFTLEYDVLVPADTPHSWGLLLLAQTLRMWYTSMVACVMHIVEPRDVPFATHEMITANTLSVTVQEEDECLRKQSCPICFECFTVGEKVRRLPCMHLFHVVGADANASQSHHCNIDRHLVRDKQCPVCKTPVDFMERLDKSSPAGKIGEGESLVIADAGDASGAAPQSPGAAAAVSAVANSTASGTGLVDLSAIPEPVALAGTGADAPVSLAADGPPSSESMAEVARGAAAHGIAAAAEVAAVVARIAPQQAQSQAGGLPAQAAELERAVRSLQSRWMQIQDVVAGMQQMLQYIEESQSMMSAARADQQQAIGDAPADQQLAIGDAPVDANGANGIVPGATDDTALINVNADSTGYEEAFLQTEIAAAEMVVADARPASLEDTTGSAEAAGAVDSSISVAEAAASPILVAEIVETLDSAPNPEMHQHDTAETVVQGDGVAMDYVEPVAETSELPAEQVVPEQEVPAQVHVVGEIISIAAESAQAQAPLSPPPPMPSRPAPSAASLPQLSEPDAVVQPVQANAQALAAGSEESATSAEALQTSVMTGLMQAMRVRSSSQPARASSTPSGGERWQPFTEAEKVCMAYMWRGRRAQLMNPTTAALNGESGSGSRASS